MFEITFEPIIAPISASDHSGGLVVFEGLVRNHNQGHQVKSLEYEIYEVLAKKEGEKIIAKALDKFNIHQAKAIHRGGHLKIGEAAVWVGAWATHRDDAFKAARFIIDEIKYRLPVWKKEHYINKDHKWVFCKDHHHHVHFEAKEYYQKQAELVDQSLLAKKSVLVIGAGGLGHPVLQNLATAGVGKITIFDFDKISISNIHRQPLFGIGDVGEPKVEVVKKRLEQLNPFIKIECFNEKFEVLAEDYDLVFDCTDNMQTKYLIHDQCIQKNIALITAGLYRFEGQIRTLNGHENGCFYCFEKDRVEDYQLGNCNDVGILGVSANIVGAYQASEGIHFLSTDKNNSQTHTLIINTQSMDILKIKNKVDSNCQRPQRSIDTEDHFELDSIPQDYEHISLVGKEDFYMEQFTSRDDKIVFSCERGYRSKQLVKIYRENGYHNFYSLAGGSSGK